jgi:CRP-like cAMP-binding protein
MDSPIVNALNLLLSSEPYGALRWSAGALECGEASTAALVVTAHALRRVGHERAAIDAFMAAARSASGAADAPLAIAAIAELRAWGVDVRKIVHDLAGVVCKAPSDDAPAWRASLGPVSPLVTRHALVARAKQLVYETAGSRAHLGTTPTFLDALSPDALRELALAFDPIIVPRGYRAVEEDRDALDLYVVACGEVAISRMGSRDLATLESGAMFGETSVLTSLPAATSAVTTQPSILLRASRAAIDSAVLRHPDLRLELLAHCRRQAVGNLGAACPLVTGLPLRERSTLLDRMRCRVFARGERIVTAGDPASGLHLVLSGEVSLLGREGGERIVLSTLGPGDVVGEADLVFARPAVVEAIAGRPTATLCLAREDYLALALDRPAILHGLYSAAVNRAGETRDAIASPAATVLDAEVQLDEAPVRPTKVVVSPPSYERPRVAPPPPIPPAFAETEAPTTKNRRVEPAMSARVEPSPSLAPVATSTSAPPPSARAAVAPARGSRTRLVAQSAGVVAVAASVAAVLAMRDGGLPAAASRPDAPASPAPTTVLATAAPPAEPTPQPATAAPPPLASSPVPAAPPSSAAAAPSSAPSMNAFFASSLKRRKPSTPRVPVAARAPVTESASEPVPAVTASSAPPASPAPTAQAPSPPPPTPVAAPIGSTSKAPPPADVNEFGGRE